jgi:pimeloyl-ACP methyl ester carboxylesterase
MLNDVERYRISVPHADLEISLIDWGGDGPLALLHHANGFCAGMWDVVAQGLRRHFRVIAMDARGHGDSDKPRGNEHYRWENFGLDAAAVADVLVSRHGPVTLGLGHSFGGTALTLAAIQRPDLFERLVLLDPIVMPSAVIEAPEMRAERTNSLVEAARRRRHVFESREAAHDGWKGRAIFTDWDPRALELYVTEGLADRSDGSVELKCPGEVEAAIFEGGAEMDVMGRLDRLEAPTLIAWASGGNFPRLHFEELAARMQRGEVITAELGHLIPMEQPEWVVRQVLRFNARSGSSAGSSPSNLLEENVPS